MSRLRSLLFVPGDRPERFDKARAAGADLTVVDLEDAVDPAAKTQARTTVAAWTGRDARCAVRINGADTPWFEDDIAMIRDAGYAAVMVPKAETPEGLARIRSVVGPHVALYPLVESVLGLHHCQALAASPGVARLIFGSIDFARDSGIQDDAALLPVRIQLVLASRLAGLPAPIDGIVLGWDDPTALQQAAATSRSLGFGGRLCIHPRQITPVHQGFAPSAEELDWARRVVTAVATARHGALVVDGKLVDKPLHDMALALLAQAGETPDATAS